MCRTLLATGGLGTIQDVAAIADAEQIESVAGNILRSVTSTTSKESLTSGHLTTLNLRFNQIADAATNEGVTNVEETVHEPVLLRSRSRSGSGRSDNNRGGLSGGRSRSRDSRSSGGSDDAQGNEHRVAARVLRHLEELTIRGLNDLLREGNRGSHGGEHGDDDVLDVLHDMNLFDVYCTFLRNLFY